MNAALDTPARTPRFAVQFARTSDELAETQRLRYRIFAGELGAHLHDGGSGLDRDHYDPHCRHLYVRDRASGAIVACTTATSHGSCTSGVRTPGRTGRAAVTDGAP